MERSIEDIEKILEDALIEGRIEQNKAALAEELEVGDSAMNALDTIIGIEDWMTLPIPLIKIAISLCHTGEAIRDKFFMRKLIKFYRAAESHTDEEDREKMAEKIRTNRDFSGRVGEMMLSLIERARSNETAEQIGLLYAAYLNDDLDVGMFERLAELVIRLTRSALCSFLTKDLEDIHYSEMDELLYSGVFRIESIEGEVKIIDEKKVKAQEDYKRLASSPINLDAMGMSFAPISEIFNRTLETIPRHSKIRANNFMRDLDPKMVEADDYSAKIVGGGEEIKLSWMGLNLRRVLRDYYD